MTISQLLEVFAVLEILLAQREYNDEINSSLRERTHNAIDMVKDAIKEQCKC